MLVYSPLPIWTQNTMSVNTMYCTVDVTLRKLIDADLQSLTILDTEYNES